MPSQQKELYKIKIIFSKTAEAKFLSHLDLIRLFYRALRRSGLPIAYTQGFNPHPKISFKRALALGKIGRAEEAEIYLEDLVSEDSIKKKFQPELPPGISIKKIINILTTKP